VPEVRRVILAMTKPKEEREFLLWDGRCGEGLTKRWPSAATQRAVRRSVTFLECASLIIASRSRDGANARSSTSMAARLTDEKWERIKPLLPPQKPPTGRPRSDHRTVLAGMVWVFGSGASWRDLPEEEFGPWRTVYGRYREWREEGLWQHIVDMLRLCQ
jgi:hypothetical protein